MIRKSVLLALPLALALSACSQKTPDSVDRMARSEVEAIVKDYLLEHPEVLADALVQLQKHESGKLFTTLISNPDDPALGPDNAKITIVEFFDYNCGYCKAANDWVFEEVDAREGDVRVIFKEYPILAQSSLTAAKAALAADRQGKYREMHMALMRTKDLSPEGIAKIATSIGLKMDQFNKDMESDRAMEHVQRIHAEAEEAQVSGTPGFFINGQFVNGFDKALLTKIIEDARKA
jgi:protein-disulfide isomerase